MSTLYNTYNHRQLIKDLIPILRSFLVSRNQGVSLKATELLNLMEKKILSELFECEGDQELFTSILNSAPKTIDEQDIVRLITQGDVVIPSFVQPKAVLLEKKDSASLDNIQKIITSAKGKKHRDRDREDKKLLPNVYLKVNTNIVTNNINMDNSSSNTTSKQSLFHFDSKQTNQQI